MYETWYVFNSAAHVANRPVVPEIFSISLMGPSVTTLTLYVLKIFLRDLAVWISVSTDFSVGTYIWDSYRLLFAQPPFYLLEGLPSFSCPVRCFYRIEAPSDVANGKHELFQLRISFYPFRCCHKAKKLTFLHPKAPFSGPDAGAVSYELLVRLKDMLSIDAPSGIVVDPDGPRELPIFLLPYLPPKILQRP
ncbi:hypothetical protein Tco_0915414 [Tanacetum coccineum]